MYIVQYVIHYLINIDRLVQCLGSTGEQHTSRLFSFRPPERFCGASVVFLLFIGSDTASWQLQVTAPCGSANFKKRRARGKPEQYTLIWTNFRTEEREKRHWHPTQNATRSKRMRPAYLTEFHTLPTIQAGHSSRPQWTVLYLIDHLLGLYLRRTRCGTPTGNGNGK